MLKPKIIPHHLAIIMDGNGRWAAKKGYPRFYGHVRGAKQVRSIVEECARLGVKSLTLYAFSTENWTRPKAEREVLWKLLRRYLLKEWKLLNEQNIKLNIIGEKHKLDESLVQLTDQIVEKLSLNTGMSLNLAISYGSRNELVTAIRSISEQCLQGSLKVQDITEDTVDRNLFTKILDPYSDVDLVIRTSGEKRVSNFLLWQSAYAEFYFTHKYWPEFSVQDLHEALEEYQNRERRFGDISEEGKPTPRSSLGISL